jgi:hypothetical protein
MQVIGGTDEPYDSAYVGLVNGVGPDYEVFTQDQINFGTYQYAWVASIIPLPYLRGPVVRSDFTLSITGCLST